MTKSLYLTTGCALVTLALSACSGDEQTEISESANVDPMSSYSEKKEVSGSDSECDTWGNYAVIMLGDYQARVQSGQTDPEAGTKSMLEYDAAEPDSMGKAYFDAILEVITTGGTEEMVYQKGKTTCLAYPVGTFNPDD